MYGYQSQSQNTIQRIIAYKHRCVFFYLSSMSLLCDDAYGNECDFECNS
jgi:hypothetical protein